MKRMVLLLLVVLAAACDRQRGMETRTYELSRLSMDEAIALITPYIREGGHVSGNDRLINVRERPDRLTLVEDLLRKYDGVGEAIDVVLEFQVIEANGFTERDPSIADIEGTLREMFKYRGYRLVGAARVQAREDNAFKQSVGEYLLEGRVLRVRTIGSETRVPVTVELRSGETILASTVTGTIGKPTVLGQGKSGGALILVIRPSLAGS